MPLRNEDVLPPCATRLPVGSFICLARTRQSDLLGSIDSRQPSKSRIYVHSQNAATRGFRQRHPALLHGRLTVISSRRLLLISDCRLILIINCPVTTSD